MKIHLNFKIAVFSIVNLWACSAANADTFTLSNPNSTIETNEVYNWLAHIPRRHDNKLLSGAFGGYTNINDSNLFSMDEANDIHVQTGQRPAIYSCDYARGWDKTSHGTEADLIDYSCNSDLINYWQNGGLIQISNHLPNPVFAGNDGGQHIGAYKKQISNSQFQSILTPGTAERGRWLVTLNKLADGLLGLQAAGVTVIYRPLHEMNGEWFWWGATGYNTNDTIRHDLFKDLYRDMYDYFTTTKQLNNLIWVYSADYSRDHKSRFYPGGAYVDIVGLDMYQNSAGEDHTPAYNEMLSLNKPFAIAEAGPKYDKDGNGNIIGQYDYSKLVDTIKSKYPETVYFLPWNDGWSPLNNLNISNAFNDSGVANRSDVRSGSQLTNIIEETTILYSFEPNTYGQNDWHADSVWWVVEEWASDKKQSFKTDIDLQPNSRFNIFSSKAFDFTDKNTLSAKVKVAHWGNFGDGLAIKFYVKTGNNYQWFDGGITNFFNNQQHTLSIDLNNVTNKNDIREIGIEITTPARSSGQTAIYIDSVIVQK